jgi:hypothetical protein
MPSMSNEEKIAIKAACVQAAATLVESWWRTIRNGDVAPSRLELDGNAVECARVAGLLYTQVSGIDWGVLPKALPVGSAQRQRASGFPAPKTIG